MKIYWVNEYSKYDEIPVGFLKLRFSYFLTFISFI